MVSPACYIKAMLNRSSIGYWTDKDKRMEAAHLLDICDNALENAERMVTPFLSPGISSWLRDVLRGSAINHLTWGGFENAERVRFVLSVDNEELCCEQAKITLIHATPSDKTKKLGHRSILGSLMSLGLEREVIGDIRQSEAGSIIAITDQIQQYILQNWQNAGAENINVVVCKEAVEVLPVAGVEKRIISASFRLDALVSASFGISRSSVQERIRLGKIQHNGLVVLKPDLEVKVGDILSCRGEGKVKIMDQDQKTRKGKNAWKIFMYTDN